MSPGYLCFCLSPCRLLRAAVTLNPPRAIRLSAAARVSSAPNGTDDPPVWGRSVWVGSGVEVGTDVAVGVPGSTVYRGSIIQGRCKLDVKIPAIFGQLV